MVCGESLGAAVPEVLFLGAGATSVLRRRHSRPGLEQGAPGGRVHGDTGSPAVTRQSLPPEGPSGLARAGGGGRASRLCTGSGGGQVDQVPNSLGTRTVRGARRQDMVTRGPVLLLAPPTPSS